MSNMYLLEMIEKNAADPILYKIVAFDGTKVGIKATAKAAFNLRSDIGAWETVGDDMALVWRAKNKAITVNVFKIHPIH